VYKIGNIMAHFAEINDEKIVQRVVVINNENTFDENGQESEAIGVEFCNNLLGGVWKQTSYNGNIRKNYAGVGYTYDENRNAFIPPKPTKGEWVLDEEICQWKPLIPLSKNNKTGYFWNEEKNRWEEIND
jgi:hypothetical protein